MSLRFEDLERPMPGDTGEHAETTLDALMEAATVLRPEDPSWAVSLLGLVLCPDREERPAEREPAHDGADDSIDDLEEALAAGLA